MPEPGSVLARTRRAVFARHANPWSAWSRWATTPLVYVPVWNRSWGQAALVGAWFALNPVMFPQPPDERAWSTRAMLGEEQWISDRPRDTALAVNAAGSAAGLVAFLSARGRLRWATTAATATQMGITLVYWQRMVRYYEAHAGAAEPETPQPTG